MTLFEFKVVATLPPGSSLDEAATNKLMDEAQDQVEMGLLAVLERVKPMFPSLNFMIID